MRYLVDLEGGIRDIEQKIKHLQTENTDLIRELCEMRAANNDLKNKPNPKQAAQSSKSPKPKPTENPLLALQDHQQAASQRLQAARASLDPGAAAVEIDTLYEPFAAMWNLIRLDPSVVKGEVSPQTVLEQLRSMVEVGRRRPDMRTTQSYPASASMGWSADAFRMSSIEQRISVA